MNSQTLAIKATSAHVINGWVITETHRNSRVRRRCPRTVCPLDRVATRTPSTADDRTVRWIPPDRCTCTQHACYQDGGAGFSSGVPSSGVPFDLVFFPFVSSSVFFFFFFFVVVVVSSFLAYLSFVFVPFFLDDFFYDVTSSDPSGVFSFVLLA